MNERVFPTKIYTFKGLRCTRRGSVNLLNKGISQYRQEEGVTPTSAVLSTKRKETLPVLTMPLELNDATVFTYSFSEELQLNQIQCRRGTLDLDALDMKLLAVQTSFTVERMVKEMLEEYRKNQS